MAGGTLEGRVMRLQGRVISDAIVQAIEGRLMCGRWVTETELEQTALMAGIGTDAAARELVRRLVQMGIGGGRIDAGPGKPPRWRARGVGPVPSRPPPPERRPAGAVRRGGARGRKTWGALYSKNMRN